MKIRLRKGKFFIILDKPGDRERAEYFFVFLESRGFMIRVHEG